MNSKDEEKRIQEEYSAILQEEINKEVIESIIQGKFPKECVNRCDSNLSDKLKK